MTGLNLTNIGHGGGGGFSSGFSSGFQGGVPGALPLPINCALADQQLMPIKKAMLLDGGALGAMRGIFGE